jgi:hypothetical protein
MNPQIVSVPDKIEIKNNAEQNPDERNDEQGSQAV